jgi:glycosyltransferase involved in cell wall biosynthesis
LSRVSICVVSTGELTPDLTDQTLQDYQLLRATSDAEALTRSGADAFLWLSSAGRLAPQALEECLWALRSADWVTWKDTGAAPMPSLQGVAGPLGISRRVMESPDPKPGGVVRRLPWACVIGPAQVHAEESIPDGSGSPRYGIEHDREGYWVGRLMAHVHNSGMLSAASWKSDPLGIAMMLAPLAAKQWVNRSAAREVFDLAKYQRFQPGSSYSNGRFLHPVRYAVRSSGGRRRMLLVLPHLGAGAGTRGMLELAAEIDRREWEVIVVAESAADNRWKERWMRVTDAIFELGRLVEPGDVVLAVLSLAMNWDADAVLVIDAAEGYRALHGIRANLRGVRVADLVPGLSDAEVAAQLPLETVDCLDFRLVRSEASRTSLQEMARDGQKIQIVRDGIAISDLPANDGRLTVGFVGALREGSGADWMPSIAGELKRLREGSEVSWAIAGAGPLEVGLRNGMRRFDAHFFRDEVDLDAFFERVDVLVVPSEDADGDRAALEAMSRGRAVVAVEAGGRAELVVDACGVLVTGGRDGDLRLAGALADVLKDRYALRQMGEHGRAWSRSADSLGAAIQGYRTFLDEFAGGSERRLLSN